jgi:tRNA A37 threonylcarbamoyltransferase TsaD
VPALLAHALHSQIEMHQAYGGVVPELASRDHIRRVLPLTTGVLNEAGRSLAEVDVVAYTRGPAWPGRCWWGRAWPARWARRWASPCWACTTWRGICSPSERRPAGFPLSPCWSRAATRS